MTASSVESESSSVKPESSSVKPESSSVKQVGVLALQGAFAKHLDMLAQCGRAVDLVEVRTPAQLDSVDALVIPGGESSTISKLLDLNGLREPIQDRLNAKMPVFGTCAGLILLAREVLDGRDDQASFGALDISVRRNGYGRQLDSFETDIDITGLVQPDHADPEAARSYRAVFIRAPKVEWVGPDVEVLATVEGAPVLLRSGTVLASVFHPELTNDLRLHQVFLDMV